tara:strand:- start:100 stop:582 length:483 start_codon:yes stop_codon:yes gene_type:complete
MNKKTIKKDPRASSTRISQERPRQWTPPSPLDAPPAPSGYVHRWLRTSVLGWEDTTNMSARLREGYELVRVDEYKEDPVWSGLPTVTGGKYSGVVGHGGLVLARIPEEIAKQRQAYYQSLTDDNDQAIKNDLMREQHPSMPINQDRQSRVSFGGGRNKTE